MKTFSQQLKKSGYKLLEVIDTKDINISIMDEPLYPIFPESKFYAIIDSRIDDISNLITPKVGDMSETGIKLRFPANDLEPKNFKKFIEYYKDLISQINLVEKKIISFCKKNKIKKQDIYFYRIYPTYD